MADLTLKIQTLKKYPSHIHSCIVNIANYSIYTLKTWFKAENFWSQHKIFPGSLYRPPSLLSVEHKRPSSTSSKVSNHIHIESPGHHIDLDEVKVLDREPCWFERGVKEAINIKVNNPMLNKGGGGVVQTSRSLWVYS